MITAKTQVIHDETMKSLYKFYNAFVASTYDDFHEAPHIDVLSEYLQRITYDNNSPDRLCVAMPPQHSKSSLVTLAYSCWLICRNPNLRILIVNAEKELSTDFGIAIRQLFYNIGSYFDLQVSKVKSSSTHLKFEKKGRLCQGEIRLTGATGSITGHPADIIIVDDPYKGLEDEFTPTQIRKKWNWYTSIIEQRLRGQSKLILLHTRWNSEDIQGLIKSDEYESSKYDFIEFPAIATENDILGRKPGEPLWDYYTQEFYEDKERTMGERQYQAIYQQKPLDLTSDFFYTDHIHWDEQYTENNYNMANCRSYDMAYTSEKEALTRGKDADYTAGVHAEKINENHYIFSDFLYKRLGKENIKKVQSIAKFDGLNKPILIETGTKGGAAKELFRLWDKDYLTNYKCIQSEPIGTKADRATALKNAIYDGKIHIYCQDQSLRKELKSQLEAFPNGTRDDLIDAMSYAYNYLKDKGQGSVRTTSTRHGRPHRNRRPYN